MVYGMLNKTLGIKGQTLLQPSHHDKEMISASHVERASLSMRMGMRRLDRLTNAFSKKLENDMHAVSF